MHVNDAPGTSSKPVPITVKLVPYRAGLGVTDNTSTQGAIRGRHAHQKRMHRLDETIRTDHSHGHAVAARVGVGHKRERSSVRCTQSRRRTRHRLGAIERPNDRRAVKVARVRRARTKLIEARCHHRHRLAEIAGQRRHTDNREARSCRHPPNGMSNHSHEQQSSQYPAR